MKIPPSVPVTLPYTVDAVTQILRWGALSADSPHSHKQIAEWCDRFWCLYLERDAPSDIEPLLPILTDVETQWDLFLANSFTLDELRSSSFDEVRMPSEWFEQWLREVNAARDLA